MMPARVKYRKMHRGSRSGLAYRGSTVAFGEYGLMALERCWMNAKQIEAARGGPGAVQVARLRDHVANLADLLAGRVPESSAPPPPAAADRHRRAPQHRAGG